MPGRLVGRSKWLRRRYARRVVKMMRKYRDKGRQLPENLRPIERQIRRLPPAEQVRTLERLLEAGAKADPEASRNLRRAASRQQRRSGKKGGGVRPGLAPGQRQTAQRAGGQRTR